MESNHKSIVLAAICPVLFFMVPVPVCAQDDVVSSFQTELSSRYSWRGIDYGTPMASGTLDIGWKGIHLEAFGGSAFGNGAGVYEIDMTAYFELGNFCFGVTDYWLNTDNPRYFRFSMPETGHLWEAYAEYYSGAVSVGWYTFFAGQDRDEDDNKQWSSYIELTSAGLELAGLTWQAQLGIVPWSTDFYGTSGFAVSNVGLRVSRDILSSDRLSMPVYMQFTANPVVESLYFSMGLPLTFE